MALSSADLALLARCVELAHQSIGLSEPNPRVGCVLLDAQGLLVGEGFTQQAGGPHAEVMALRDAAAAGRSVAGGTAWVSLEPCAHHGRTPPCADALVAAGLKRVVVATTDPFAAVAGQGIARLRAAGIVVELADAGPVTAAAQALNIGFFSRVLRQRPWVRLKLAASLDGRTALPDGRSQWITSAAARADGHAWRQRAGAVLTGLGTVQADDPRLDVRLVPTQVQPLRLVLDSAFATPPTARVLAPPGRCLVVGCSPVEARMQALRDAGAELLLLPATVDSARAASPTPQRPDLAALLAWLALNEQTNELHVEAGATLSGAFWQTGLVDELLLYVAPKLLGPGLELMRLPLLADLADARALRFEQVQTVGPDLALRLQVVGADGFLTDTAPTQGAASA